MALDPQALLARRFEPIEHRWRWQDSALYALGVGLGFDPLDARQLPFVYEGGGLKALPTMANVLAYPGFWVRETSIDWRRLVHAEQQIELHAVLAAEGRVIGRNRVSSLWDKGAAKGALMQQRRELHDAVTGAPIATVTQLSLLRGDGGFGEASPGSPPPPHALPERPADTSCDLPTLPQAALLYRLCGDPNPLHADPEVARTAGFDRPILHGMATMGVAAHAVLRALLDYDASRIAAMRVRFTAPALPGDTLRTELWTDGEVVSLRTRALERGVVVLDHGRVDLRPVRAGRAAQSGDMRHATGLDGASSPPTAHHSSEITS